MTRLSRALAAATVAVVAGFGIHQARQASALRGQAETLKVQGALLAEQIQQLRRERARASNQLALLTNQDSREDSHAAEVVRLRGERARLKQEHARLQERLPALPSFAPGNTNGVAEGDYTSQDLSAPRNGVPYSPGQAAGHPDTRPGNFTTAWTPREAHAGLEWLQLEYATAVDISRLRVHEATNSGAITRVTAALPDGAETVLSYTHQEPGAGSQTFDFIFNGSVATAACVRFYFDTTLAPGRIAVDTVEMGGRDGTRQWPVRARASSYYDGGAQPRSP